MATIYDTIGEEGFTRVTRAFYARVLHDDILGPMYPPEDMDGAELRLRLFLIFRFGGPDTYIQQRGHPALRMRHNPFPIDAAAADRWLALMDASMAEAELPDAVVHELREFFEGTARFLINKGERPPEPMVALFFEREDGTPVGATNIIKRQLPVLEPGLPFRLDGVDYTLLRAERMEAETESIRLIVEPGHDHAG